MVAATGSGVAAIGHEFFGRKARLKGGVVEKFGVFDQLCPCRHRVDIDLDNARVRGDTQQLQARVARGRVAFQNQFELEFFRSGFNRTEQVQVVFELLQRWHKDVEHAGFFADGFSLGAAGPARVAHLNAQGSAADPVGRLVVCGRACEARRLPLRRALCVGGRYADGRAGIGLQFAHRLGLRRYACDISCRVLVCLRG